MMKGCNTPFDIRILLTCFFDKVIVVVGTSVIAVHNKKQHIPFDIPIIIAINRTNLCFCIGIRIIGNCFVNDIFLIMVADGHCHRRGFDIR
ncbi:hypothetical protein SDC9_147782 [bioreactor metagenome]|uniref:Uncharacterized protein n=1 Tax=bioreactor metagenome TaxID=1076179 RepID=A0A645EGL7_9ZZZZ